MQDNLNPHNLDAEEQILGAIMIDNSLIRKVNVTISDFYAERYRKLYRSMLELSADGLPIDFVSLKEKGHDPSLINRSLDTVVTTANIHYHADIVRECSNRRKLRAACLSALNEINEESIDTIVSNLRNRMSGIVKGRGCKLVSAHEIAKEINEFLERRAENKNELSGIPSGFSELDKLTDGWQGGVLIILAARPGQGKSAFAMTLAQNADVPVGIISIEMGKHQLGIRTLATLSGIELWKLRKGLLNNGDWPHLTEAFQRFAQLPLYFSFSSKNTIEIERTITEMIEVNACEMIILDYLQLTKSNESKKREQEVAEISRLLKTTAQTHNIPIIALSQLNREVEKRENKRPMLSDLRESGAIEQDADVVIFLYREKMDADGIVELIIGKGRNIGGGTIKLNFHGDTMTFENMRT
jgi:replicative DNA helicase